MYNLKLLLGWIQSCVTKDAKMYAYREYDFCSSPLPWQPEMPPENLLLSKTSRTAL